MFVAILCSIVDLFTDKLRVGLVNVGGVSTASNILSISFLFFRADKTVCMFSSVSLLLLLTFKNSLDASMNSVPSELDFFKTKIVVAIPVP